MNDGPGRLPGSSREGGSGLVGKFRWREWQCRPAAAGSDRPALSDQRIRSRLDGDLAADLGELRAQVGAEQRDGGDDDGRDQGDEQAVLNGGGALGGLAETGLGDEDERGEVSGNSVHVGGPFSTIARP